MRPGQMKVQLKSNINTKKLTEGGREGKWTEDGGVEVVGLGKGWLSGAGIEERFKIEIHRICWELTDTENIFACIHMQLLLL